jgi:hypothetical protein
MFVVLPSRSPFFWDVTPPEELRPKLRHCETLKTSLYVLYIYNEWCGGLQGGHYCTQVDIICHTAGHFSQCY